MTHTNIVSNTEELVSLDGDVIKVVYAFIFIGSKISKPAKANEIEEP